MNYLIDEYKILFVHMPKCGGTSLLELFQIAQEKYYPHRYNDGSYDFAFTVVRNPYTRIVSSLNFNNARFYGGRRHLNLHSLMDIVENDEIRCAYHDPDHTRPLERIKRNIIPMTHADNRIDMANVIYRFENYKESVYELLKSINFKGKYRIPHTRPSPQPRGKAKRDIDYKSYFDQDLKKRMLRIYGEDLDRFKYTFDEI